MRDGVLLVAKAPVPGRAKTRLAVRVGARRAADLAAASLLDTLDACEAVWPEEGRVIALTGNLAQASRSAEITSRLNAWHILAQHGRSFAERLVNAHLDTADVLGTPIIQLGMDTPQLDAGHLHRLRRLLSEPACDAVVAPALDGGWWALGISRSVLARALITVPMSTPCTGRDTLAALERAGARVWSGEYLRDVDELEDASAVAAIAPDTRFAAAWRGIEPVRRHPSATGCLGVAEVFDAALAGVPCRVLGLPEGTSDLPVERWQAGCTAADHAMVDRCVGPTLDIGCGPGRLTEELGARGVPALGIDVAARAVQQTRERGAWALRRDVFAPLPAEGRWHTALLADGNIGIGGDPGRMLSRVAELIAPGGQLVVETGAPGLREWRFDVKLESNGSRSHPFPWAVIGLEALVELASARSMRVCDTVNTDGRWFVSLAVVSKPQGGSACGR